MDIKWISFEDQFPGEELKASGIRVLINGKEHCAYWCSDADKWVVGGWENCCYCGGNNPVTFNENQNSRGKASHWMPLITMMSDKWTRKILLR